MRPKTIGRHAASCTIVVPFLLFVAQAQYRVVGYYPMWNKSFLPPSAIHFTSLTHINHAFAWPNADGSISSDESPVDTALINTTHRSGRKILLSFGGAGTTQTINFATVAADSNLRKTFIANVVSRIAGYHYDGADLDWEGPANNADKANEAALVKGLRDAFHTADSTLLITMAIGASGWSGQWRDYGTLSQSVDWFNAMEYDFHGSWSSVAGHNAPLYVGTDPVSDPDYYSLDLSYQYLAVTRAIPKGKIVLGVPFYGKSFGTTTLYSAYSGEQDLAYRDIMSVVNPRFWNYVWDDGSKAPYYVSASQSKIVTLDDSTSIAMKCDYAKTKGLSGVMIWEITQDVIGPSQPLLDVIESKMLTTTLVEAGRKKESPSSFALASNYPNPFNPTTVLSFELPVSSRVSLKIFDLLGREVAQLVDEEMPAGRYRKSWDASRMPSGTYFYRLTAGSFVQTQKMVYLR